MIGSSGELPSGRNNQCDRPLSLVILDTFAKHHCPRDRVFVERLIQFRLRLPQVWCKLSLLCLEGEKMRVVRAAAIVSLFASFSSVQAQTVPVPTGQVAFPVVVTDSSGKSVHGLQKSDFDVHLPKNGSFESVEEVPVLSFSGFADPVPVFVLFDEISIFRKQQTDVARLLLNYLRKAADDHVAVTVLVNTPAGVRVIHDMATETKVFTTAMDRVLAPNGEPRSAGESGESEEFELAVRDEVARLNELMEPVPPLVNENAESRYTRQLNGLQAVGMMLQRSRKRKPLIWITGEFPVFVENGGLISKLDYVDQQNGNAPKQLEENYGVLNSVYEDAIDALNTARLTVYPLQPYRYDPYSKYGLSELARRTSGTVLADPDGIGFDADSADARGVVHLASLVANARQSLDSYYVLRFSIPAKSKTIWCDSSVKVHKPDTKIFAASGFFSVAK
jgi:hypothetical protein